MIRKWISKTVIVWVMMFIFSSQIICAEEFEENVEQDVEISEEEWSSTGFVNEEEEKQEEDTERLEEAAEILIPIETEEDTEEMILDCMEGEEELIDNTSEMITMFYNKTVPNILDFNKLYSIYSLQSYNGGWGTAYRLQTNIPQNGRVKLRIINLNYSRNSI